MDTQALHEKLEQLHAELERTQTVDPSQRELLRDLMEHIQAILEHSEPVPPQRYASLGARLSQAAKQIEDSRPDLVMTIGHVIDHLAQV